MSKAIHNPAPLNPNSVGARHTAHVLHGFGDLDALEKTPPLVVTHGKGVRIFDDDGKEYIEAASGVWSANLGFNDEALIEAAIEQLRALPYYHALMDKTTPQIGALAEHLKRIAPVPMAKVFFANSGSEANDTLVKLAWYYNNARGKPRKKKIISRHLGFHGVTCAAASVTGIDLFHTEFDLPINDRFLRTDCPHFYRFGEPGETEEEFATRCAGNLEQLILDEGPDTVAAFFAEPAMGSGGCIVPPRSYFEKIQAVLDKYDVLLFADEVITGFGRTGKMFGCETFGIRPDAMSLAKGLSSSYQPISAIMLSQKLYDALLDQSRELGAFAHGFTTTGHPVAIAVALRCQQLIEERDILGHVNRVSPAFQNGLKSFADHRLVGNVRGVGMMGALELVADRETRRSFDPRHHVKTHVVDRAREHGVIIRYAVAGDTLSFAPPLIITESEIEEMLTRFSRALDDTTKWIDENDLCAP